jgi:hypothetical protein
MDEFQLQFDVLQGLMLAIRMDRALIIHDVDTGKVHSTQLFQKTSYFIKKSFCTSQDLMFLKDVVQAYP